MRFIITLLLTIAILHDPFFSSAQIDYNDLILKSTSIYTESVQNESNADSLISDLSEKLMTNPNDIQRLNNQITNASYQLEKIGQYSGALNLLQTIIDNLRVDTTSPIVQAELFLTYSSLGELNMRLRDNKRASNAYLKALNIAESLDCDSCMAIIYNNLGEFYLNQNELDKTKKSLENALELNTKLKRIDDIRVNYTNLGIVYNLEKDYQKAKDSYDKALELLDTSNIIALAIINLNISQIYSDQKQYKTAEVYLRKGLAIMQNNQQNIVAHKIELVLAKCMAHQQKKTEAIKYAKLALQTCNQLNIAGKTAETYRTLADVYLILNDSAKAVQLLLDYEIINDSLNLQENKDALNRLLSVYEIELLKKEKLELEQTNQINKLTVAKQRIAIASAAFIVLLLTLLIFVMNRKFKSDKEKERLLNQQKELMLAYEKEQFEQQRLKMEQEIDFKNRQLTTQTLTQAANNEFKITIVQELGEIKKMTGIETPKTVNSRIDKLMISIKQASDNYLSEDFKTYFDSVHPSFYENLLKTHPDLSANDIRLCSFLKMGLSTKEIASLTFREIRSVESARNRLRKKLQLDAEANLNLYMTDF